MAADYEVTLSLTDSESFRLDVPFIDAAGDPVDLTGKAFEYILSGCGSCYRLDDTNGLSVDLETGTVSIALDPDKRLCAGNYEHGLRSTDGDDVTVQHFDGEVSVTKGGF